MLSLRASSRRSPEIRCSSCAFATAWPTSSLGTPTRTATSDASRRSRICPGAPRPRADSRGLRPERRRGRRAVRRPRRHWRGSAHRDGSGVAPGRRLPTLPASILGTRVRCDQRGDDLVGDDASWRQTLDRPAIAFLLAVDAGSSTSGCSRERGTQSIASLPSSEAMTVRASSMANSARDTCTRTTPESPASSTGGRDVRSEPCQVLARGEDGFHGRIPVLGVRLEGGRRVEFRRDPRPVVHRQEVCQYKSATFTRALR